MNEVGHKALTRDRSGIPIPNYFTLGIGISFHVPTHVHKPVPIPFPNLVFRPFLTVVRWKEYHQFSPPRPFRRKIRTYLLYFFNAFKKKSDSVPTPAIEAFRFWIRPKKFQCSDCISDSKIMETVTSGSDWNPVPGRSLALTNISYIILMGILICKVEEHLRNAST